MTSLENWLFQGLVFPDGLWVEEQDTFGTRNASWQDTYKPLLDRTPDLLMAKHNIVPSERACRALGILVAPATAASKNEEPLLDKTALNWKAGIKTCRMYSRNCRTVGQVGRT